MLPTEMIAHIFRFQEDYKYFRNTNNIIALKKLQSICHIPTISCSNLISKRLLHIIDNKFYELMCFHYDSFSRYSVWLYNNIPDPEKATFVDAEEYHFEENDCWCLSHFAAIKPLKN